MPAAKVENHIFWTNLLKKSAKTPIDVSKTFLYRKPEKRMVLQTYKVWSAFFANADLGF